MGSNYVHSMKPKAITKKSKKSFSLQSEQKSKQSKIFWEFIASAEVSQPERSNSNLFIYIFFLMKKFSHLKRLYEK